MSTTENLPAGFERLNGNPDTTMRRIGIITLNTQHTYRYQGYECAAWWQEVTCEPQTVELRSNGYYVGWAFDGIVTDAYFGSLWGGVPVGSYDKARDTNKPGRHSVSGLYGYEFAAMIAEGRVPDELTVELDDDVLPVQDHSFESQRWDTESNGYKPCTVLMYHLYAKSSTPEAVAA